MSRLKGMSLVERFEAQTCPEPNSGCLLWTGSPDRVGYGQLRIENGGPKRMAHNVAFFLEYGRWPADKLLHDCDTRACVNLDHLHEGSQTDNMRECLARGRNPNARKTHCKRGHPFSPENTYVYPGERHCKTCVAERARAS